jgi:antitoxin HicB
MLEYAALFAPDKESGGYVATFPDFSFGVTQGETIEETLLMAADVLKILIIDRIEQNLDLPRPSKRRARCYYPVSLPALQDAKAVLYQTWRQSGITKSELARRLAMPKSNVDRLFDLSHHSRLEHIEAAFSALGKKMAIQVRTAA